MAKESPPYFHSIHDNYVYRTYVTSSDLIFYRLGAPLPHSKRPGSGKLGALVSSADPNDVWVAHEAKLEYDSERLNNRDAQEIRDMLQRVGDGFCAPYQELEDVRIDYTGKWVRYLLMKPKIVNLSVRIRGGSRKTFLFEERSDIVVAVFEMQRVLGDDVQIGLRMDEYRKALKKYKKLKNQ